MIRLRGLRWWALAGSAPLLVGCVDAGERASRSRPNGLVPSGEGAEIFLAEWWVQLILGTVIFIGVMALLGFVLLRGTRRQAPVNIAGDYTPSGAYWWVGLGGIALPLVVLTFLMVISVRSMVALAEPEGPPVITIEVTGHRWWWEVRYLDEGFVTANEVRVPVGSPVQLILKTNDVQHSFWVPQIHGKVDMVPGREYTTWLQANEVGAFRGICAEFCGLQHARMHFMLVAMPPDMYQDWLDQQRAPAPEPAEEAEAFGRDVFLNTTCAYCHTIRGTPAAGSVGPDLTHVASRLTLAAGVLDVNPGNFGGWIADPQRIKPGALMPPTDLTGEELTALIAYLMSLR